MNETVDTVVTDFLGEAASSTLAEVNAGLASSSASTTVTEVFALASSSSAQAIAAAQSWIEQEAGWLQFILGMLAFFGF